MNIQRHLFVLATLACAILASGQQRALAVEPANTGTHSAASITDFCGIWRYGNLPWFIPPASGPVTNLSRDRAIGVSDYGSLVGDKNPILQPSAADVVKKKGENLAGRPDLSKPVQIRAGPTPYRIGAHADGVYH